MHVFALLPPAGRSVSSPSNSLSVSGCQTCFSTDFSPGFPAGQHLHRGLRRRLPRDHPGSSLRLHLHRFRHHPQRSAHLHPLQQVLGLLLQTQVQPVHRLPEETREGQIRQSDVKQAQPLLWEQPSSHTLKSSVEEQQEHLATSGCDSSRLAAFVVGKLARDDTSTWLFTQTPEEL